MDQTKHMAEDAFKLLNTIVVGNDTTEQKDHNCIHVNSVMERNQEICVDCGEIISKNFSYEKEWRYYGSMDTKHIRDPNRCNVRKLDEKGIFKDLEKYQINKKVIASANEIYETVTQNRIFRGNTRKGIIFACVFHAYNCNKIQQSCKSLMQVFDIEQKIALKGLKFVNLNLPKDIQFHQDNSSNDVEHLIQEILVEFNATPNQIEEVIFLYRHIQNKSSLLNRSRPQSVACGLIRYYITKKNPQYSMEYFREKIKLSELTLTRIVKEIDSILS